MPNPEAETLIAAPVRDFARHAPERWAFLNEQRRGVTFAELASLLNLAAEWWRQREGAPVLVYLPHGCAKGIQLLGLLSSGICGLTVSVRTPPAEVGRLARDFHASGILTTRFLAKKIFACETLPKAWIPPQIADFPLNQVGLFSSANPARANSNLAAWLLMTSGSTGAPKAVELSPHNLMARTADEIDLLRIVPGDQILNCLSFAHDLGLNQLLTAIHSGATLRVLSLPMAADLWRALDEDESRAVTGTPLLWTSLFNPGCANNRYRGTLTISGGSLTETQLEKLRQVFPHARIVKTYGQTETFRSLAENRQELIGKNSAGSVIPGVTALVVNEHLEECALGEVGQLVHFGHGTASGYFDDPVLTAQKFIQGGRLSPPRPELGQGVLTGDYFRVLNEQEFQFVGRRDDMLKRMDHRIYLSEVQHALLRSPLIQNSCVLEVEGCLVAWIEPRREISVGLDDVQRYMKAHLPKHQIPDEVHLVEQFPRTFSEKIDHRRLLEMRGARVNGV